MLLYQFETLEIPTVARSPLCTSTTFQQTPAAVKTRSEKPVFCFLPLSHSTLSNSSNKLKMFLIYHQIDWEKIHIGGVPDGMSFLAAILQVILVFSTKVIFIQTNIL